MVGWYLSSNAPVQISVIPVTQPERGDKSSQGVWSEHLVLILLHDPILMSVGIHEMPLH